MRFVISLFFLPISALNAVGFANGVKVGEVTEQSAVLWARLTELPHALNREANWKPDAPNWTVPGQAGEIQFSHAPTQGGATVQSEWLPTSMDNDFCRQIRLDSLKPGTEYRYTVNGRSESGMATLSGNFKTAPSPADSIPIHFAVSTCQEFETRDNLDDGHKIYRSMAKLKPAFFVQTGDTVYYDRKPPLAKNMTLARYRWNRMYALPSLVAFHRNVPSYWMHDDHDILKDDCFPGQTYGDLTWDQGIKIWREQIPQSDKPYRTFRWGKHVQIWLAEGREYRSPNNMPDGPDKSILGKEQWQWLDETFKTSDATFKVFVSATPVVGPDRDGKNDNHANAGFEHEGGKLRKLLSSTPGCFVINGDRHWQYHSVDAGTGLNEFGCGASTDKHAQGWNQRDKRPEHRFLRVAGGFAEIRIGADKATFVHRDVDGKEVYSVDIPAPKT